MHFLCMVTPVAEFYLVGVDDAAFLAPSLSTHASAANVAYYAGLHGTVAQDKDKFTLTS
jgi:hypothetical protein